MKDSFIEKFPIIKGNKENPYLIIFDAYCGQGKSYISKIISKYDNSIIMNNDEVRSWLDNYENNNELLYELQQYRLELLLKNNNSCIMDSCSCINWDRKKKILDKLGYKYYIIRLICSDNTIKERIKNRTYGADNYSKGTYEDYIWQKENVPRIDDSLIDYTIDTEKDIDEQVKDFINKYNLK